MYKIEEISSKDNGGLKPIKPVRVSYWLQSVVIFFYILIWILFETN